MFRKLIFFYLISFFSQSLFAEEQTSEPVPSETTDENLATQNTEEKSEDNQAEPEVKESADHSELEEDAALDSWIKKTPVVHLPKEQNQDEEVPAVDKIDQSEAIEEEKKVYKELISSYKEEQRQSESIKRVFQKATITKLDQQRINSIKFKQRKLRKSLYEKYQQLVPQSVKTEYPFRVCNVTYEIMSLPSELKRFKQVPSNVVSKVWKNSIYNMYKQGCDVVILYGIASKTTVKTEEFLEKTINAFRVLLDKDLKYEIIARGRVGSIAFLYDPNIFELLSKKVLNEIYLRRGEQFIEKDFSIPPAEFVISQKKVNKSFRIISNEFVYGDSVLKPLKAAHMLQIASGLRELVELRGSQDSLPNLLSVNMRFGPEHPAYHVLVNSLSLNDFLSSGACKIVETEEVLKKTKIKRMSISHECDEEKVKLSKRSLFNVFSDLYRLPIKASKAELKKLTTQKSKLTSGFFILQKDIAFVYSNNPKGIPTAGVLSLGNKDLSASLTWSDYIFK